MMYGYGYGLGISMIIGWVIMAAIIVFSLYGLITLIRRADAGADLNRSVKPLDILKERLAKGEIDMEEYKNIKKELITTEIPPTEKVKSSEKAKSENSINEKVISDK